MQEKDNSKTSKDIDFLSTEVIQRMIENTRNNWRGSYSFFKGELNPSGISQESIKTEKEEQDTIKDWERYC